MPHRSSCISGANSNRCFEYPFDLSLSPSEDEYSFRASKSTPVETKLLAEVDQVFILSRLFTRKRNAYRAPAYLPARGFCDVLATASEPMDLARFPTRG